MLRFAVPVVFAAGLGSNLPSTQVVAIIPARYGSTRLPGKPLALIDGRPMIEHVYRRVCRATLVDAAVVATDDRRIADAVAAFGATAVMTRDDHETGTDRLAEVAAHLACRIVVNVQGDEPLLDPASIDQAIRPLFEDPTIEMSTLRRRIDDPADAANPNIVKIVVDRRGDALYFTRASVPYVRTGQPAPPAWKHFGLYVYRREALLHLAGLPPTPLERAEGLEQLRALEHGLRIRTVETQADSVAVDTPEDLERVRRLVNAGVHP